MTDITRLGIVIGTFLCAIAGWALCGTPGAGVGWAIGILALVLPWHGQPLWRWGSHYLKRNQRIPLTEPVTVANDRSAGGVRYQDGVAVAVVQVVGRAHRPTVLVGSTGTETVNALDAGSLLPLLRQSLGLGVESVSVITAGARRRSTGDYPRVYDTLIGTAPYAGQREMWLVIRIRDLDNGDALRRRATIGSAALATAQRVAAALREQGVRARVATAADIVELEARLGRASLGAQHRRWGALRGDGGWLATYAYRPAAVTSEGLAAAWTLNADAITQNLTVFPDGTCQATVTTRTSQPPVAPPSVVLKGLAGQQHRALANTLCGPRRDLAGQVRSGLPPALWLPVGQSGVLLGKIAAGDRLLLPLTDPGDFTRVRIAADDAIAKRIVIRLAAMGERVTVHSSDVDRWDSVRMPSVVVTDRPRPAPGTTVSVVDGTVSPAPRPAAVIDVDRSTASGSGTPDVLIAQTGPATVEVRSAGVVHDVEMEFFRAENRYADERSSTRRLLAELA